MEDEFSISVFSGPSLTALPLPSSLPAVLTIIEESLAFGISFVGEPGYILHVLRPCGGGQVDWLKGTGLDIGRKKDLLVGLNPCWSSWRGALMSEAVDVAADELNFFTISSNSSSPLK